jgi:hypothetical protein
MTLTPLERSSSRTLLLNSDGSNDSEDNNSWRECTSVTSLLGYLFLISAAVSMPTAPAFISANFTSNLAVYLKM